jgi:hypothetical protein
LQGLHGILRFFVKTAGKGEGQGTGRVLFVFAARKNGAAAAGMVY